MRFGFAGVGHPHARAWAEAVADNGGRVVAVYDPATERGSEFVAEVGGEQVAKVERLGDLGLDAVVVDARCDEVAELALAVLKQGLPILIEKPGGMVADDLARIDEVARKGGLVTQMGYFLRYADPVLEARRAIAAGELGQVSLTRCHAAMPDKAWETMGEWFRDSSNITSIFQEDACHAVDIVTFLLGAPRAVIAQRAHGAFEASASEDVLATIFDYGTHLATIDFTAHEANPWIETWSIEVYGTKGTLRFGLAPAWLERFGDNGWEASGEPRISPPTDGHRPVASTKEHYRRGVEGLIRAVRDHVDAPVNAAAGLRVFRIIEAILESADTGRRVEL